MTLRLFSIVVALTAMVAGPAWADELDGLSPRCRQLANAAYAVTMSPEPWQNLYLPEKPTRTQLLAALQGKWKMKFVVETCLATCPDIKPLLNQPWLDATNEGIAILSKELEK